MVFLGPSDHFPAPLELLDFKFIVPAWRTFDTLFDNDIWILVVAASQKKNSPIETPINWGFQNYIQDQYAKELCYVPRFTKMSTIQAKVFSIDLTRLKKISC